MPAPFCTVLEDSADEARRAGAQQLGVPPEDVAVSPLAEGRFRVEVVRAPFRIEVEVAPDGMQAVIARIEPALGDAPQPTRADVVGALAEAGVTAGVLEEEIDRMLELVVGREMEQRSVVVARGERPRRGADACVTEHFERAADGGAGRRLAVVRDGELLVEREPATEGEPGFTVAGDALEAQPGEDRPVAVGDGIVGDGEGRSWRSSVPGLGYLELDAKGVPRVVPAITVSADRLSALADLRVPTGGDPITRAELDEAIVAAGVTHGLQSRRVAGLWTGLQERGSVERPVPIALGTPPRPGRDAGLELAVPVGGGPGAIDAATGRIDYHERRMVTSVSAGRRIGTWRPATAGVDGVGVDGAPLPAAHGAQVELVLGAHVEAGEPEAGRIPVLAAIDGAVAMPAPGHVDVVDVLDMPQDVDYATGNLDVRGCVHVRGTVRSGFRVTARHDVAVDESIEEATVEAGGTLTVGKGILGGRVSAKERVAAHYAQNASIACGGDVDLHNSAINSTIVCGGRLTVSEGPGRLQGGRYAATRGIRVRELGSDAAVPTVVVVGRDPGLERKLQEVREEQRRLQLRSRKLARSLGAATARGPSGDMTRTGAAGARNLMKARRDLSRSQAALEARRRLLEDELFRDEPPVLEVLVRAHPGVEVHILDAVLHVEAARGGARYRYDRESRRIDVGAL